MLRSQLQSTTASSRISRYQLHAPFTSSFTLPRRFLTINCTLPYPAAYPHHQLHVTSNFDPNLPTNFQLHVSATPSCSSPTTNCTSVPLAARQHHQLHDSTTSCTSASPAARQRHYMVRPSHSYRPATKGNSSRDNGRPDECDTMTIEATETPIWKAPDPIWRYQTQYGRHQTQYGGTRPNMEGIRPNMEGIRPNMERPDAIWKASDPIWRDQTQYGRHQT
ncbi:uncharacterized protein [Panulirus ornatus]|uniref:uncharacterized protein isoform X1 n=1 Tax=Panulirus ornatus TaxID=150431 RepID=UPI003A887689